MKLKVENVIVTFFLDGERYGMRVWAHVPRVGDEVMLNSRRDSGKIACVVNRVVWGVEAETDIYQSVNIAVDQVKETENE